MSAGCHCCLVQQCAAETMAKSLLDKPAVVPGEDDEIPDVFGELGETPIFVITAY